MGFPERIIFYQLSIGNMNLRVIINSLLFIFIIHIILINFDTRYTIGSPKEHFSATSSNGEAIVNYPVEVDKTMDFLNSEKAANEDEFKKKLYNYIQEADEKVVSEFDQKNRLPVDPANEYISNDNVPNFESNVADIKQFYKVSLDENYDNLNANQLQDSTSQFTTNNEDPKISPTPFEHYGRDSTEFPAYWKYNNELPMNGGLMNGVSGFDSLESGFADYSPNKLTFQTEVKKTVETIPHNDLRKPIIYEN